MKTFGYKRAEVIAALINLTTLVVIGLYLIFEAIWRFFEPEIIQGWIMIAVAGVALVIDIMTAMLTYRLSKTSMNVRAAFLHNITDALASVGVIAAGLCIIYFGWVWVDALATLVIAGYVLWQGVTLLPKTIHLLMEGTPEHLEISNVISAMQALDGVTDVHHVHIWQLDEHRSALEAHIVVGDMDMMGIKEIKCRLKEMLSSTFSIHHSTLEFEHITESSCGENHSPAH